MEEKMKHLASITFSAFLVFSSLNAFAKAPVEIEVPVEHVYAPVGFDTNDRTEIVVEGFLPNLCYQSPKTSVEVIGNEIKIKLTSLYTEPSPYFCTQMIVPFTETVKIGLLNKGNYKLTVNGRASEESANQLIVTEAMSNAIDSYSYAYVEYIERTQGNSRIVKLKGYNPSDCFELEKIDYISNGIDAYSILPKMKQVSSFCPMKMVEFEYDFEVPNDLNRKKVLLHVRTMNGKSVNTIFSNL
jgi:hypothetical protein